MAEKVKVVKTKLKQTRLESFGFKAFVSSGPGLECDDYGDEDEEVCHVPLYYDDCECDCHDERYMECNEMGRCDCVCCQGNNCKECGWDEDICDGCDKGIEEVGSLHPNPCDSHDKKLYCKECVKLIFQGYECQFCEKYVEESSLSMLEIPNGYEGHNKLACTSCKEKIEKSVRETTK